MRKAFNGKKYFSLDEVEGKWNGKSRSQEPLGERDQDYYHNNTRGVHTPRSNSKRMHTPKSSGKHDSDKVRQTPRSTSKKSSRTVTPSSRRRETNDDLDFTPDNANRKSSVKKSHSSKHISNRENVDVSLRSSGGQKMNVKPRSGRTSISGEVGTPDKQVYTPSARKQLRKFKLCD